MPQDWNYCTDRLGNASMGTTTQWRDSERYGLFSSIDIRFRLRFVGKSPRMNEATPYPAINTVLTEWAEGLERLLGTQVVGLYLSGSLA